MLLDKTDVLLDKTDVLLLAGAVFEQSIAKSLINLGPPTGLVPLIVVFLLKDPSEPNTPIASSPGNDM